MKQSSRKVWKWVVIIFYCLFFYHTAVLFILFSQTIHKDICKYVNWWILNIILLWALIMFMWWKTKNLHLLKKTWRKAALIKNVCVCGDPAVGHCSSVIGRSSSRGWRYSWASLLHISAIINKLTHACKVSVKY